VAKHTDNVKYQDVEITWRLPQTTHSQTELHFACIRQAESKWKYTCHNFLLQY